MDDHTPRFLIALHPGWRAECECGWVRVYDDHLRARQELEEHVLLDQLEATN